jgi:hypothetical protein
VEDLDLPFCEYSAPGLVGEVHHQRLAALAKQGWLARSPLAYVVRIEALPLACGLGLPGIGRVNTS